MKLEIYLLKLKSLKKEKKEYLLENSGVIFEYFEKKKEVSMGKSNKKNDILHSFFNKEKKWLLKIKMKILLLINF